MHMRTQYFWSCVARTSPSNIENIPSQGAVRFWQIRQMLLLPFLQVVAVPYETGFDHQRVTDDVQFKTNACLQAIGPEVRGLPVYGVGHSLGSLLTLMLNARFAVHRDGNALISFNNRPATDVIPFLSPLLAPGTRALGLVLSQVRCTRIHPGSLLPRFCVGMRTSC
jgi:hypothetical protein